MSRRLAATSLAAGLALLVAAPLAWWLLQPEPAGQTVVSVNAAAAEDLNSLYPMVSGASGMARISGSTDIADPTALPVPSTAPATSMAVPTPIPLAPTPAPAGQPPSRIEIPSLGVDAEVVQVGVDAEGLMEIPADVDTVGWYRFGPAPGAAAGSAVLSGHVDDYRQGTGVFARIGDLVPGDVIRVTDPTNSVRQFQVVAREEWSKGEVPIDRLFDRGGAARLVLITCGGSFNSDTLGYDDNIAVTATPVAG